MFWNLPDFLILLYHDKRFFSTFLFYGIYDRIIVSAKMNKMTVTVWQIRAKILGTTFQAYFQVVFAEASSRYNIM